VPQKNNREFLLNIMDELTSAGMETWVFGGWAEELRGISAPRDHADIDLLYPAPDLNDLDAYISSKHDWAEIPGKRFPHKRAITCAGIMVEFFLVQNDERARYTDFFRRYRFDWPEDTFEHKLEIRGKSMPVAGKQALHKYRKVYEERQKAYSEYDPF
jgi:hypothetical protein